MTWPGRLAFAALVVLAFVAWNLAGPPPPAPHEDRNPTLTGIAPEGTPAR